MRSRTKSSIPIARSVVDESGRVTIPKIVRRKLKLRRGDMLTFEEVNLGVILIRKSSRENDVFLRALESTLSEWNSPEDEEAFRDL